MKLLLLALVAVASAEPESFWYQNQYGYVPNTLAYANQAVVNPYFVNNAYQYSAFPYVTRLNKREAEAEADHHVVYANQFPLVYGAYPSVYSAAVGEPVYKNGNFHTALRNVQKGVHSQYTAGVGEVYQPVVHNLGKREAEAEADPLMYINQPYFASVAQYPYTSYFNRAYTTYQPNAFYTTPSVVRSLGKREAESEPFYPVVYPTVRSTYYPTVATPVNAYPYRTNVVSSPFNTYFNGIYA